MKIRSIVIVLVFLALSVTANAVTIFDKQGTALELNGDLQVQYRQKIGVDKEPYVDYDDLELGFHATHELDNGWTGFGVLVMDWKGQAQGDNDNAVDEAYVGLGFGPASFRFGRMYYGSDDFAVEKAYEMDIGTAIPATDGDEGLRADAEMG
ncbi:MAG: porin, partial [Desulfobacteraceae bacterium]|nr:porin [Desulfobacteraceae bacterium]